MQKKTLALIVAAGLVVLSSVACSISVPSIRFPTVVPRVEVGSMEEYEEEVPLEGIDEARVEVRFGAGEITLVSGEPDSLFSGHFRTNVAAWAPEVTWQDGVLRVEQGSAGGVGRIGLADPGAKNEWDLEFSPEIPLEMDLDIGASQGELDFTGLALTELSLEMGASDLVVRFDEPNSAQMDRLTVEAGAANLRVDGIGNAGPERVTVEGGAGNLILDFAGDWRESARVEIRAGVGSVTVRLPEEIGVRVEVEGALSNIDVDSGLALSGGAYVNQAYGETEVELLIEVTLGLGNLELELVGE